MEGLWLSPDNQKTYKVKLYLQPALSKDEIENLEVQLEKVNHQHYDY